MRQVTLLVTENILIVSDNPQVEWQGISEEENEEDTVELPKKREKKYFRHYMNSLMYLDL